MVWWQVTILCEHISVYHDTDQAELWVCAPYVFSDQSCSINTVWYVCSTEQCSQFLGWVLPQLLYCVSGSDWKKPAGCVAPPWQNDEWTDPRGPPYCAAASSSWKDCARSGALRGATLFIQDVSTDNWQESLHKNHNWCDRRHLYTWQTHTSVIVPVCFVCCDTRLLKFNC